ncbi:MAG: hypothetical protein ABI137_08620 [Antricoccus sp.]
MPRRSPSLPNIGAFILTVVVLTTVVILVIYAFTSSWAGGAVVGGIAGVVTVALYPIIFRSRIRRTREDS